MFKATTACVGGKISYKLMDLPATSKRITEGIGKTAPVKNINNANGKLAMIKAWATVLENAATTIPTPITATLVTAPMSRATHRGP